MSDDLYRYVDAKREPLAVGAKVQIFGFEPTTVKGVLDPGVGVGTVTAISDPDGDVNGEGRVVGIDPVVTVLWPDGGEERFTARWLATGPWDDGAPFGCDDLEVMPA